MALSSGFRPNLRRSCSEIGVRERLWFENWTRMIGRKRVFVSQCLDDLAFTSSPAAFPPLKQRSSSVKKRLEKPLLEELPQDILVRILCFVDQSDLKGLYLVSKSIKEAAVLAEKSHFAFSTPSSKTSRLAAFSDSGDFDDSKEAPNAPRRQRRFKFQSSSKRLKEISVALFED